MRQAAGESSAQRQSDSGVTGFGDRRSSRRSPRQFAGESFNRTPQLIKWTQVQTPTNPAQPKPTDYIPANEMPL